MGQPPLLVDNHENGQQLTGQAEVFHDAQNKLSLEEVFRSHREGQFISLHSAGSTGLKPGAYWSHFSLKNVTSQPLVLYLEYVDHQLIALDAYNKDQASDNYALLTRLSMSAPFEQRPIPHNRFVFEVQLKPEQTMEYLVKFSSDEVGFLFPGMRIWTPTNFRANHTFEISAVAFLFGGFFLMSVFALVAAIASGEKSFYAYSIYSFSKITVWSTVLGYTHQYLITEHFHWSYMSISAAITIFCGLLFARIFLQTTKFTPKLDYLLLFMMSNTLILAISALLDIKVLALLSITLALLLYPVMTVVGIVRWRQGSKEAAVFAIAWSLLVFGLVVQALRDMGYVEHNFINYYWPPVASFSEMLVIMAAMGVKVRRLRHQKDAAETKYRLHLEQSKAELEQLVRERTSELEKAKQYAEEEARTDPLTGICNRRSFLMESEKRMKLAQRKREPLSLLMFDIDHFKTINDTHGHSVGDEALRSFTHTILKSIRETDIFGRLGGEEFGLLLNEAKENAVHTAERLRSNISRIGLKTPEGTFNFTSSIGIAHREGDSTIDDLLKNADRALYEAKNQGRNIVVEHHHPPDSTPNKTAI
ncbi:GGDEF domain-containing protein [Hahella sp. CCB-MM4]|nr:GGDEF domain-containing protein [Hahella sp. CCB-MM4]